MAVVIFVFVVVIGSAAYTWWKDAQDGVNR